MLSIPIRMWQKIDHVKVSVYHLKKDDKCCFAREYISGGGYASSETNQLISNYQIPWDPQNKHRVRYKHEAVAKFAQELTDILEPTDCAATIPSSIPRGSPNFDLRCELLENNLRQLIPGIRIIHPFVLDAPWHKAKEGGERNPTVLAKNLTCKVIENPPKILWLIDDVITTGGHFKACQRVLKDKHPKIFIGGIFWARTVWPKEKESANDSSIPQTSPDP